MAIHFRDCLRDPCFCDLKRYRIILGIAIVILSLEVIGGLISGSLALLSDAGHVLADTFALSIAMLAEYLAVKNPVKKNRIRITGALINVAIILAVAIFIVVEATDRLRHPQRVLTGTMMLIAIFGTIGNYAQAKILGHDPAEHAGRKAVRLHVLSDLWQSFAVVFAGILIWITGKEIIDPILSVIIAATMAIWAIRLIVSIAKNK